VYMFIFGSVFHIWENTCGLCVSEPGYFTYHDAVLLHKCTGDVICRISGVRDLLFLPCFFIYLFIFYLVFFLLIDT
jgi:hypothetical protein